MSGAITIRIRIAYCVVHIGVSYASSVLDECCQLRRTSEKCESLINDVSPQII